MSGDDGHPLQPYVDRLETAMGAWFPGERVVFRGCDLHRDLGRAGWTEVFFFGITGRRLAPREIALLEALMVHTSFPDPRLWNNRVAALAGSARSSGALGVAAGIAVSEATVYGYRPNLRAYDFLKRAHRHQSEGGDLAAFVVAELKTRRSLPGFGRPIVANDERIEPLMTVVRELGFQDGPHLRTAFAVEEVLRQGRWRLKMNVAAVSSALLADIGFSAREYHVASVLSFLAGMLPCYVEAADKPEGAIFPLPCNRIAYEGPPPRSW